METDRLILRRYSTSDFQDLYEYLSDSEVVKFEPYKPMSKAEVKKTLSGESVQMALLNFFSRLTYENILSPMILMRSANNSMVLGTVNAIMGVGGILGGIIVSTGKVKANSAKMIYIYQQRYPLCLAIY